MILLASSLARESDAFTALFTTREWASQTCRSVADCRRAITAHPPRIAVLRSRFPDGHSDEVLKFLTEQLPRGSCRVIVLAPPGYSTDEECRQLAMGADHVFRDPVRLEVLVQLITRYRDQYRESHHRTERAAPSYDFAGVTVFPTEHRLVRGRRELRIAPKIIELVQLLHHSAGRLVSYTELYDVLFSRRFGGETSNCRVLLGKADAAFRQLGVSLRDHVQVVAKSGYLYSPDRSAGASRQATKR